MNIWLQNLMVRYLVKRGWVVFYLEPYARFCPKREDSECWLWLWKQKGEIKQRKQL